MSRLEQGMQQILRVVGNRPQENTVLKITAYQPISMQPVDEQLRYLEEQVLQLRGLNSEENFNAINCSLSAFYKRT